MSWRFEAYAWSHAAGTVIKGETPVVYHFQETPELMNNISPANLEALKILEKRPGITKHLGVTYKVINRTILKREFENATKPLPD